MHTWNCTIVSFLCHLLFYSYVHDILLSIFHPFPDFWLCHSIGWCRRARLRTRDREYSGITWRFLAFSLSLESSCRLWFRTSSWFLFILFCWIIWEPWGIWWYTLRCWDVLFYEFVATVYEFWGNELCMLGIIEA